MMARIERISMQSQKPSPVRVNLRGRYMLASQSEHPCEIVEMSTEEIFLATSVKPTIGEKIVIYVSELGRFEGDVSRVESSGFAISMNLPNLKHKRLAEQLTWYGNRAALDLPDSRHAERVVPLMQRAILVASNGKERIVKINDISLTGVSIETTLILIQGSRVVVGATPVTVARIFEGGFFGEFFAPFAPGELSESTKL